MAHEYASEAKKSHDKKLESYGGKSKASSTVDRPNKESGDEATNFAGFRALNTDRQAGMAPLSSKSSMSKETMPRIMKKKGGAVHGAESLKRLDKAPRTKKASGGQMMGTGQRAGAVPSADEQQMRFDPTTRVKPGEMAPGTQRKKGGRVQDYEDRSHESQGSQGLRPREGHKKGGKVSHEGHMNKGEKYGAARTSGETKGELDSAMRALKYGNKAKAEKELGRAQGHTRKTEYYTGRAKGGSAFEGSAKDEREDKKLEKKYGMSHKEWEASEMDKKHDRQESMKGLKKGGMAACSGGRMKRDRGGSAFDDYMGGSSAPKSAPKKGGKESVTIINIGKDMLGQQQQGPNPLQVAALADLLGPKGGPAPMAPPPPGAGAMPPPGAPMPAAASPPVPPQGASPMMPPGGMTPPGGMIPRKDGGKVQVPYRKPSRKDDYPAMDFGSGGGFGRKQKIDSYGTKGPKGQSV